MPILCTKASEDEPGLAFEELCMRCCEFESRCSGHKQIPVMNQLVTDLEATGYGAPSSTLNHLVADTSRCVPEASSNGERCPDGYDTVVLHEYLEESP